MPQDTKSLFRRRDVMIIKYISEAFAMKNYYQRFCNSRPGYQKSFSIIKKILRKYQFTGPFLLMARD